MYLLYLDESGAVNDPNQKYFVLAGIALFERQGFWIASEMDKIAARFHPADPNAVELHGNPMYGGRKMWRQFPKETRHEAIKDCLKIIASSHPSNRIFACVIDKERIFPDDPVKYAFEQIASRFDYFLIRLHKHNDPQRGVIIFDKSTYETTIQNLATDFRTIGHTWGVLRNLAEVPLFLDSRASRLIQMADLVAYSLFRAYTQNDTRFSSIIADRIDKDGNVIHGLFERI
ncbi:MAG: DUF3800 domain-containing protein [Bacteroidia bacterium]|nr:DUF3800 domain-containing protein [Bacteroidia bacterium]